MLRYEIGKCDVALRKLREREAASGLSGSVGAIMQSLKYYLEGNLEECLRAVDAGKEHTSRDPESLYYMGRQLAEINDIGRAGQTLSEVVHKGYLCGFALRNDPCFAVLRSSLKFSGLLDLAERRYQDTHRAFLEANGPKLLNLSQPTTTIS